MFEASVTLLSGWLDAVHIESAAARVADMRAKHLAVVPDSRTPNAAALSGNGDVVRASLHEASHAVAAHLAGFKVDYARIRPDGTGEAVHYEARQGGVNGSFATVQVHLAGIAIELLGGAGPSRQFTLAHSYDLLAARIEIEKCQALVPSWTLPHRTFAQMACCLVAANRNAIQRTAACLRAVGELDGAEVSALCAHSPP